VHVLPGATTPSRHHRQRRSYAAISNSSCLGVSAAAAAWVLNNTISSNLGASAAIVAIWMLSNTTTIVTWTQKDATAASRVLQ